MLFLYQLLLMPMGVKGVILELIIHIGPKGLRYKLLFD